MRATFWIALVGLLVTSRRADAWEPTPDCWQVPFGHARCAPGPNARVALRVRPTPARIVERYGAEAWAFAIDLARDGRPEYVVQRRRDGHFETCFLSQTFDERRCWEGGGAGDGFASRWFVELERGRPLYLVTLGGDEDTDEFMVDRVDPATWELTRVLEFEPILRNARGGVERAFLLGSGAFTEGATDLDLVRRGGRILLRAVPPGGCTYRLPGASHPDRNQLVGIVFRGRVPRDSPGSGCAGAVAKSRLLTLEQVIELAAAVDDDGE